MKHRYFLHEPKLPYNHSKLRPETDILLSQLFGNHPINGEYIVNILSIVLPAGVEHKSESVHNELIKNSLIHQMDQNENDPIELVLHVGRNKEGFNDDACLTFSNIKISFPKTTLEAIEEDFSISFDFAKQIKLLGDSEDNLKKNK